MADSYGGPSSPGETGSFSGTAGTSNTDASVDVNVKQEPVTTETKSSAAHQKASNAQSQAPITVDDLKKLASSNPLAVTPLESFSTTMRLRWMQYRQTNDTRFLDQALECLDHASPYLRYGPHSSTDGVTAFFDFGQDFSITDAELLQRELKSIMPTMQSEHIYLVRKMLIEKGWTDRVLPNELVALLSSTHWLLALGKKDTHESAVDLCLGLIAKTARHVNHESRQASVPSFGNVIARIIIAAYRDDLKLLLDRRDERLRALALRHGGGMTSHTTIQDLMKKGGEAVDIATQQNIIEQLCHIHAVQLAAGQDDERELLVERIAMLDQMLQMLAHQGTNGD